MYKRGLISVVVAALAYYLYTSSSQTLSLTIKDYLKHFTLSEPSSPTLNPTTMALASLSRTVAKKVYAVETPEVSPCFLCMFLAEYKADDWLVAIFRKGCRSTCTTVHW